MKYLVYGAFSLVLVTSLWLIVTALFTRGIEILWGPKTWVGVFVTNTNERYILSKGFLLPNVFNVAISKKAHIIRRLFVCLLVWRYHLRGNIVEEYPLFYDASYTLKIMNECKREDDTST